MAIILHYRTKKSLTLAEYTKFLDTLAKMKKLEIDDLKEKVSSFQNHPSNFSHIKNTNCNIKQLGSSGPPVTNRTTVRAN